MKTRCSYCEKDSVYSGQGQDFCKTHFLEYFESKVIKTVAKHGLIGPKDKVCVAASGGKDSVSVLYILNNYCKKHKIELFALCIDEGIKAHRDQTISDLKEFCRIHGIQLHIVTFKEKLGDTFDNIIHKGLEKNKKPCTVCGIFRRTILNRSARELGATKLVTGHNLDDEAQSFMMNTMLGNMAHNASLGPITGLNENSKFVPRVKPLYFMLEREVKLYAQLKGFKVETARCPNITWSFRAIVRDELDAIESKVPGIKNGIVNSFQEILPMLKDKYRAKRNQESFNYCSRCGDACSGKVCNSCMLEEELCLDRD